VIEILLSAGAASTNLTVRRGKTRVEKRIWSTDAAFELHGECGLAAFFGRRQTEKETPRSAKR
jgi:hypothetical protein